MSKLDEFIREIDIDVSDWTEANAGGARRLGRREGALKLSKALEEQTNTMKCILMINGAEEDFVRGFEAALKFTKKWCGNE